MSDEEWRLIVDLVAPYWTPGSMGRPVKVDRRRVVDAIFYVTATGCQWRALPSCYPNWNTVHRYHLLWSRDGTWERIAERLAAAVRKEEGRDAAPSAGIVDARSVRATPTVSKKTKGYDAGKKVNGRKTFGVVDTLGLLIAVTVVAANLSDNVGGITVADRARHRSSRFAKTLVRRWFQALLHRPLPPPSRRRRSGEPHPPRPVQSAPQTLDRRTHLGLAHEQPATPG
jgi:transposase